MVLLGDGAWPATKILFVIPFQVVLIVALQAQGIITCSMLDGHYWDGLQITTKKGMTVMHLGSFGIRKKSTLNSPLEHFSLSA